jgi:CcmD family protein
MKRIASLFVLVLLLAAPLHAQQPPPKPATSGAQDGFVPVDAPLNAQDAMPAPRLVAIAYGFIWIVLFGYLWSVKSRLARVEREMEVVSRRVGAARKPV